MSLLVHACVGVACCFLAAGPGPVPEPAGQATLCELPVTLASLSVPERERPIRVEEPEPRPSEPLVLDDIPPVEPDAVSLPAPPQEALLEVPPPEAPEAPAAWVMEAAPPSVVVFAVEAPRGAAPAAPAAVEPSPSAVFPPCSEEPAAAAGASPAPQVADRPAAEAPQAPADGGESAPGPSAPPTACAGNAPPAYPRLARRQGHEGVVVLRARISPSGACMSVAILRSSGHTELDEAAVEAVRAWQFRPALVGGKPVEAELQIPIRFRLTD